jgi:hypothetical protein
MNRRVSLALITLVAAVALPAAAAPYLVYQGTLTQSCNASGAEVTALNAKIAAKSAAFHKLSTALQNKITNALSTGAGSSTSTIYLIVDEQNVANYTFVLVDPTNSGAKANSIVGANLTPTELPNNFLSGFQFPTSGNLAIFRLGLSRPTGLDSGTGAEGSYVLQIYGTGTMNTTPNARIAAAQPAESFNLVTNGVTGAHVTVPAFPAIVSATGSSFVPTLTGTAFGYYMNDAATQSIGVASTKGTFTLSINQTLTQLANNGGKYVPNLQNVANIAPIASSDTVAFKTWAKSVASAHGP